MYAVIKTGGKQYRVKAGDLMVVEKLAGEPGDAVTFGEVLMLGDGEVVTIGAPVVDGAEVAATLIETRKGEKIKIFKKIRRQGYRRTRGHRQTETVLRVTSVAGGGKTDAWDGVVDMTTKAVLDARARNLRNVADALMPPVAVEHVETVAVKARKSSPVVEAQVVEHGEATVPDADVQAAAASLEAEAAAPKKAPAKKKAAPKAADTTEGGEA